MLCTSDSRSVSEKVCHVFGYLLEMPAWCVCVCQLFQNTDFFFQQFVSLPPKILMPFAWSGSQVEPSGGYLEKKVFELLLLKPHFESLAGGRSIISAARGATKIFKASCWTSQYNFHLKLFVLTGDND